MKREVRGRCLHLSASKTCERSNSLPPKSPKTILLVDSQLGFVFDHSLVLNSHSFAYADLPNMGTDRHVDQEFLEIDLAFTRHVPGISN